MRYDFILEPVSGVGSLGLGLRRLRLFLPVPECNESRQRRTG